MVNILLIITLAIFILTIIIKALSYIFDVMDDFFPFTQRWYTAADVCETIAEFLFTGSILTLAIAAFIHLIGG